MRKFWITDNRFKYIGLLLFLMFLVFMLFFYLKADEITKDPCSICSKRMGEKVFCSTQSAVKIYYPNGSISTKIMGDIRSVQPGMFNFSGYNLYD